MTEIADYIVLDFQPRRVLSFDIEEWYHANYDGFDYSSLTDAENRLDTLIPQLIDLLVESGSSATFFVLGEVAKGSPHIVKMIDDAGFPVASHGLTHRLLKDLSDDEIEHELKASKDLLESLTGKAVRGFRAPCFAVNRDRYPQLMEQLEKCGYTYDSSIVPVRYAGGGFPGFPPKPFKMGNIIEFPIGSWGIGRYGFALSGGHFRFLPSWLVNRMTNSNLSSGIPVVFYLHPKDVDENNPKLPLPLFYNFVHLFGTKKAKFRLAKMLKMCKFSPIEDFFED